MSKNKILLFVPLFLLMMSGCASGEHVHDFEYLKATRPTLDTVGYTKDFYYCSKCHNYYLDEKDEEPIDISGYIINKKTEIVEIEKDYYSDIYTINNVGNFIDQLDWNQYADGIGEANFRFYSVDDRQSLRISSEQLTEYHKLLRDTNGGGYSSISFLKTAQTRYITFDYKYYDLNDDLDDKNNHIKLDYNGKTKSIDLQGDNSWHSISIDLEVMENISEVDFSIYHFDGELFISNLFISREIDINSFTPYEINNITENGFEATFGLQENLLPIGKYKAEVVENYKRNAYLLRRELKTYIGDIITLNKVSKNKYEIVYNGIEDGDIIVIDSNFIGVFNGIEYRLNLEKVSLNFFKVGGNYYHYVNRQVDVVSYLEINNPSDLSLELLGLNCQDSHFYPSSSSNIIVDGMYAANTAVTALSISNNNIANILFDEQEIISFIRINTVLSISGFFQDSDNNNHGLYIYKHTFKYDGYEWKIVDNDTPITPYHELDGLNIGFWNGDCHFQSDQSLEDIAKLGINVIVGVNPTWHNNFNHVLDKASELGIKFIVDPRGWDAENKKYADWDGTCPSYANHEAVLGFFMFDEPQTTQFAKLKEIKDRYDTVMPKDKLFFVNMFPGACGLSGLYGDDYDATADDYEDYYVKPYIEQINPPAYAWDVYPLFDDGDVRKAYYCDFDVWSYQAKQNNIPLWYSFLASKHGSGDGGKGYCLPTDKELRWQLSVGLSYGIKNYLGYIYASNASDYVTISDARGDIINQALYDDVQSVNYETKYLSTIYSYYSYQGTSIVDVNDKNMMFQNLKHNVSYEDYLQNVTSSEDLLIGLFNKEGNEKALMITNAGSAPATDYKSQTEYNYNLPFYMNAANIVLNSKYSHAGAYVYSENSRKYIDMNNSNRLEININSYSGAFVVFVD